MAGLRAATLVLMGGLMGAVAAGGFAVTGCNGDDSTQDAGDDGAAADSTGPDVRPEAAPPDVRSDNTVDAPPDTTPDVTPDRAGDAPPDVRPDADSGPDVVADVHPDGQPDVLQDAQLDVTVDAEGGPTGPNPIQQYAAAYGQAFCAGQGKCCPGYPGSFDQAGCAAASQIQGWEYTLPLDPQSYTAGHLAFNATQGAACLAALQNFACTTLGTVTAAQYSAVTTACLGVLTGTIPNGTSGCLSSFECMNGYCNVPDGGSLGTCTALVGSGNGCSAGNDSPDQMCSQAGAYQPMLWCNRLAGGATGTCVAPLANGATCYVPAVSATYFDDYGCTSLLCGDDSLCGDPATYPTPPPGFCEAWPSDAGGGG
jgi:hypothetical protein